ncbi:hypothetical protein PRZ48_006861 [Zasmidium cellare]|uniref:TRP C-terminal domain-containing protein n=1 Tax=Zasmidium cellare TaxID=395010 RepID=A0ABR0EIL1_ZASCE|nr:hypothetical protein PRZ48_006861 [Zasmidium cellare]
MHNLLLTFVGASLWVTTIATYLQPAACPGYSLNTWTAGANYTILDARLDHAGQNGTLSFIIGRSLSQQECQMLPETAFTVVSITRSDRTLEQHVETPAQCAAPEAWRKYHQVRLPVTVDLGPVSAFSNIGVKMRTTLGKQEEVSCLMANVTAAPTTSTQLLLRWIPVGICVFVLFVSAMRTVKPVSRLDTGILPGTSEFLLYLQFAFLTGSLTLKYPGFFQPVLGHLNIFSLFNPGPLGHIHAYKSIEDGIYTMNGTYGGTLGFELMHQIVGVPQTADTWWNMIIAVFILAFTIAVVLEIQLALTGRRQTSTIGTYGGFKHRFSIISKAVFSYFTLPICALTFYQTNYTTILPVYHMTFALGIIVLVLLAFIWLFRQSTPDSMGEFVVGRPKETQQHKRSNVSTSNERAFVVAHFAVIFIRGAVIGSLQHFPGTQLIMLLLCEFGLFLAIVLFRRIWIAPTQSPLTENVKLGLNRGDKLTWRALLVFRRPARRESR